ncbi:hypothetical protein [Aureitalea marina]|uniref:Sialidase n=1 Tax=Aureitalea marina TaxID=930804 RepID=A0A2S7KQ62_9FLAO|nr:hypothetical protein [Aureitalea marina]PQB04769.1 hypothetical protein BST85_07575 [Aureitalea marina]
MKYAIPFISGILALLLSCQSPTRSVPTDTELSLQSLAPPSGKNSSLVRLYPTESGLWLSWVEQNDSLATLFHGKWVEGRWEKIDTVAQGTDWFNNWADFPQIAVNNEYRVGTYLQRSADGKFTYDIKLNHNGPNGWTENLKVNKDTTQSEHGFVSIIPLGQDSFFLTWLDGRNTGGSHDHDHGGGGAMTLRGAKIGPNGELIEDTELDPRVCDCCNTAVAMTDLGPIVAYRDRTEFEIRDISVVREVNGSWTTPVIVNDDNWEIPGCPVNGPALDAIGSDVALAWFTAANGEGEVRLSFSEDSGANFQSYVRLDAGEATGRVDLELLDANTAAVIWMEPQGEMEVIRLKIVDRLGSILVDQIISETSPERASGFPQLALYQQQLIFAWTELMEMGTEIRIATMPFQLIETNEG